MTMHKYCITKLTELCLSFIYQKIIHIITYFLISLIEIFCLCKIPFLTFRKHFCFILNILSDQPLHFRKLYFFKYCPQSVDYLRDDKIKTIDRGLARISPETT